MGEQAPVRGILIGDAVVPALECDHDVMTVYDFETIAGIRLAKCNWVVGPKDRMEFRAIAVETLRRIRRTSDVD